MSLQELPKRTLRDMATHKGVEVIGKTKQELINHLHLENCFKVKAQEGREVEGEY